MLRYQSYKNPEELAVFQQGVQRWVERVGNVEVQTDIVPQGEYIEKLLVRISGGDPPDMMEVNDRMSSDFIMRSTLLELTDRIKRDGKEVDLEDLFPAYRDVLLYKGKRYGIPDYCGPTVMYVNKLPFQQAGQPLPDETWDWEQIPGGGADSHQGHHRGQGARPVPDHQRPGGQPVLDAPAVVELRRGHDQGAGAPPPRRDGVAARPPGGDGPGQRGGGGVLGLADLPPQRDPPAGAAGRLPAHGHRGHRDRRALAGAGVQDAGLRAAGPPDHGPPPKGPKGRRVRNSTLNATIPVNAKQPDEAWELVKFHTGPEGMAVAVEGQRTNSTRKSVMEAFKKSLLPWESYDVYAKANELYTQPMPMTYNWTLAERMVGEGLAPAYRGEKSPPRRSRSSSSSSTS